MIADLDESIKKMLQSEIPIKNGEIDVRFEQPTREWSARLNKPTINFFLYDVRENVALRQHQWEQLALSGNGGQNTPQNLAQLKRTPFRLDCHYMMTTWTTQGRSDDEHRLLTLCLLTLFRHPTLPQIYCQGQMQQQPFDIPCRTTSHDKLTNPAEIWSALDNEMRPSISYLVTIALDPWQARTEEIVRQLTLRLGVTPSGQTEALTELAGEKVYIGGQVVAEEKPQSGIQVALKGTGFVATTDDNGRYRLGSLSAGDYTLIVWPEQGKPRERSITVPGGTFDIEL